MWAIYPAAHAMKTWRTFPTTGEVSEAIAMIDRETGRSRGFGFVEMAGDAAADAAVEPLDGTHAKGQGDSGLDCQVSWHIAGARLLDPSDLEDSQGGLWLNQSPSLQRLLYVGRSRHREGRCYSPAWSADPSEVS